MLMMKPLFAPHIREDRSVIEVAGEGALAFLNNILTADLAEGKPSYGALLSPQGKILHDLFVLPGEGFVWLDVARGQAQDLLKRLTLYRLRAKLTFAESSTKAVAVSADNTLPGLSYADPRLRAMGYRSIVDRGVMGAGTGYDLARIAAGLGDSVEDIGSGEMFVHEANLDQLNGVSFTKGCYVGQEVVSRTQHRGTARSRILPVEIDGTTAHGDAVMSGDQRIGTLLSQVDAKGLALVRLDRLAEATQPLASGRAHIKVRKPHWARFELLVPDVAA
jgi:tRNA-modifying protein YgfZ